MRKLRVLITYVSSLLGLLTPVFAETTVSNGIKVGVVLPLSGEASSVGDAVRNGITLAYEKLDPIIRNRMVLVFEDDALKPTNTISAVNKLIASDAVSAIITAGSGPSNAAAPLAEQYKIPLLAIATDPRVVQGRSYVMNFWVTPEEEARVAVPEALRRGYKEVARVATQSDFAVAVKRTFDQAAKNRLEIVLDEELPAEVRDFRTYITRVRARADVDAVFVLLLPGQAGLFAKQARQLGLKLPLFSYEMFEDNQEAKMADGALVGQWYVNADDPNSRFLEEYRKRYPQASLYGAANGHDLITLLGAAMQRSSTSEELNRYLHEVRDFKGVLGTFSASGDNRFTLPAAVKEVTERGFRRLPDSSEPSAGSDTIKVGVILSLTGGGAYWGTNALDGLKLALDELNSSGGVSGKRIEIVVEDEKCSSVSAVSAFQKLTEVDGIKIVIGAACSSSSMAIAPLAERKKVLMLSPCSEVDQLSQAGDYIFRMWTPNSKQADVAARYVREVLKRKRVAILSIQNDFGESLASTFSEALTKRGGEVAFRADYSADVQDLKPLLNKMRAAHVEALYLASYISDGILAVRQFRELHLDYPVLVTSGLDSPEFRQALGRGAEGVYISNLPDTTTPEFRARFSEKYKREWPGIASCAPFGYEAMSVIGAALRAVGPEPDKLKQYLYECKDFQGVAGPIAFDQNGDLQRPHAIFVVQGGDKVPTGFY